MKTKLEWRHGSKVLKIDDVDYEQYPEDGDVIEMNENGQVHRFRVEGVESAVVILETVADDEPVTPTTESSKARTQERLQAERDARSQTRTFRIAKSTSKSKAVSKPLSKTSKGNRVSSVKARK